MRDRVKRRNQKNKNPQQSDEPQQGQAPLQPTFLDRESSWGESGEGRADAPAETVPQPVYEAQPEKDPFDSDAESASGDCSPDAATVRADGAVEDVDAIAPTSSRRRRSHPPVLRGCRLLRGRRPAKLPRSTNQRSGAEAPELDAADAAPRKAAAPKGKKGAVVLAIGLPGSGKSSWFKRHNIIPLSSDLVRGLLFDDATEQRFQDLVFSSLRSLLRARLIAGRPMNFIDATNLSPKERHSWIKMAHDFGYEAHAVFFDVPTEVCMERNRKRLRNVPDEVMLRMAQKLRPPKFDEGFAKVIVVRLKSKKGAEAAAGRSHRSRCFARIVRRGRRRRVG